MDREATLMLTHTDLPYTTTSNQNNQCEFRETCDPRRGAEILETCDPRRGAEILLLSICGDANHCSRVCNLGDMIAYETHRMTRKKERQITNTIRNTRDGRDVLNQVGASNTNDVLDVKTLQIKQIQTHHIKQ